jgi:phosphatidylserine decarboxylase
MHKTTPGICLEGLPYIGLAVFTTLVFALLGWWPAAVVALALTFLVVNFFRDPLRVVPTDPGLAVSAADGRVVKVGPGRDPVTGEDRLYIAVFMNIFNVHVNRFPVAGSVSKIHYIPGKFVNACLDKASSDNERNIVVIRDEDGRSWTMVQIAGLVARRIVCWAEEGDTLRRGQPFGVIKFGSRVDLYLPADYVPYVVVGQRVLAGQTPVAGRSDRECPPRI